MDSFKINKVSSGTFLFFGWLILFLVSGIISSMLFVREFDIDRIVSCFVMAIVITAIQYQNLDTYNVVFSGDSVNARSYKPSISKPRAQVMLSSVSGIHFSYFHFGFIVNVSSKPVLYVPRWAFDSRTFNKIKARITSRSS